MLVVIALCALTLLEVTIVDAKKALLEILSSCAQESREEFVMMPRRASATPTYYVQMVSLVKGAVAKTCAKESVVVQELLVMQENVYVHLDTKEIQKIYVTVVDLEDNAVSTLTV